MTGWTRPSTTSSIDSMPYVTFTAAELFPDTSSVGGTWSHTAGPRVVYPHMSASTENGLEGRDDPGRRRGQRPCAWCGSPVVDPPSGRRKLYCRRSCRQRAYESRRLLETHGLPEGSVVLSGQEATDLMDRIFAVRCACEDLDTALREEADSDEVRSLAAELVSVARDAERLR